MRYMSKCKVENVPYPRMLQPPSVLTRAQKQIGMDFIERLLTSNGKDTILVVVDHFIKYGHFLSLKHPYLA